MKKYICLLLLIVGFQAEAQRQSPRQLYPGLFEQVQTQKIYSDGKTFVDAIPKGNPKQIEKEYLQHKNDKNFNLKSFVNAHFRPYTVAGKVYVSDVSQGVRKHIDTLWQVLSRKADVTANNTSLIPLPYPYIVPGGRFREVYYWDSYFTMLGLQQDHQTATIQHIVDNFAYLIRTIGFIPNGNRTYYLTRSQPPFFALMVELLAKDKSDAMLVKYKPELLAEYNFWMRGAQSLKPGTAAYHTIKLVNGTLLNRYWDSSDQPREESYLEDVTAAKSTKQKPGDFYRNIRAAAESGWDFSSRWFTDGQHLTQIKTTDIAPVDLNALMYHLEMVIAKAYQLKGRKDSSAIFTHKALTRQAALLKYCWNEQEGWFMDYNWQQQKQTNIKSLAGSVPLFFGMASQRQSLRAGVMIQSQFLKPGGLITTLTNTGQQWDAPNAWAPLQYVTIIGLEKYHQHELAQSIAKRWIAINTSVFNQTGKLMEKYNVTQTSTKAGGGEYPLQDGFGWTNGVLLTLINEYK